MLYQRPSWEYTHNLGDCRAGSDGKKVHGKMKEHRQGWDRYCRVCWHIVLHQYRWITKSSTCLELNCLSIYLRIGRVREFTSSRWVFRHPRTLPNRSILIHWLRSAKKSMIWMYVPYQWPANSSISSSFSDRCWAMTRSSTWWKSLWAGSSTKTCSNLITDF